MIAVIAILVVGQVGSKQKPAQKSVTGREIGNASRLGKFRMYACGGRVCFQELFSADHSRSAGHEVQFVEQTKFGGCSCGVVIARSK
jgi:hypothetical protein